MEQLRRKSDDSEGHHFNKLVLETRNHIKVIQFHENDNELTAGDLNRITAIHLSAASNNSVDIVRYLVDKGVDIQMKDQEILAAGKCSSKTIRSRVNEESDDISAAV